MGVAAGARGTGGARVVLSAVMLGGSTECSWILIRSDGSDRVAEGRPRGRELYRVVESDASLLTSRMPRGREKGAGRPEPPSGRAENLQLPTRRVPLTERRETGHDVRRSEIGEHRVRPTIKLVRILASALANAHVVPVHDAVPESELQVLRVVVLDAMQRAVHPVNPKVGATASE
ncbi:hypothetical protein DFJ74DRAFT_686569 [Hyaloraphidium curvatum]|nr:hypothetical protein DFJ74DRAFT_686569 [Hyaloraphidium curvatum]